VSARTPKPATKPAPTARTTPLPARTTPLPGRAPPLPARMPPLPEGTPPLPGRTTPLPALKLSLQFADAAHRALLPRHRVQRWLRRALERPAELTVRIVGEAEARALNLAYRGQDHATNVLTFDYQREPVVVADLVLAAPVVAREARAQRLDLAAHYAHLLVHGALHAQGWDHLDDADAAAMEARESELMRSLGLPDPYAR
jgi:probable rRNA maturation factor